MTQTDATPPAIWRYYYGSADAYQSAADYWPSVNQDIIQNGITEPGLVRVQQSWVQRLNRRTRRIGFVF